MRTITVDKQKLLESLKTNRDAHRAIFLEALEGFRTQAIKELETRLAAARSNKHFDAAIYLQQPEDHTKDYTRVIQMLEMDISRNAELTEAEFKMYVQNDWSWTGRFLETNSAYSSTANTLYASFQEDD